MMNNSQYGFTLTEVILSLCLLTGLLMTLLQQQWQTLQLTNQMLLYNEAIIWMDNTSECTRAGLVPRITDSRFRLVHSSLSHQTHLSLDWQPRAFAERMFLQRSIIQ